MIRVSTDRDTQCEIIFATALCNQTFWGDSAKKMGRKIKCNAGSLNITLKNCQKSFKVETNLLLSCRPHADQKGVG